MLPYSKAATYRWRHRQAFFLNTVTDTNITLSDVFNKLGQYIDTQLSVVSSYVQYCK